MQHKAIAHPTDSRLLEIARAKLVDTAKGVGLALKQTHAKEGAQLSRKAGRYAHARQFKRMKGAIKRQRTIVGRLQREIERKASAIGAAVQAALGETLNKAKRIWAQSAGRKAVDGQLALCQDPRLGLGAVAPPGLDIGFSDSVRLFRLVDTTWSLAPPTSTLGRPDA